MQENVCVTASSHKVSDANNSRYKRGLEIITINLFTDKH